MTTTDSSQDSASQSRPVPPQANTEQLTNIKNDICASIYGLYYYELPTPSAERVVVDRIIAKALAWNKATVIEELERVLNLIPMPDSSAVKLELRIKALNKQGEQ